MDGQGNTRFVHTAEHYLVHASTWVTMLSEESQVEKDKQWGLGAQNSRELAARESGWGFVPPGEKWQQNHE